MAQISYFFDSVGGDRVYSAGSFADWMHQIMSRSEGVLDGLDNELSVFSSGGLAANVATGIATKGGRVYKNDAVVSPTLDAVSIGYKRIDRIVIRFDAVTNRAAVATIINGAEVLIANAATAPAITSGTDVLLAQVLITNTSGTYSYAYTDERVYFRFNLDSIPAELTGKNAATATTAASCTGNAATATNADKIDGMHILILDIGDWNMDTASSKGVAHGLGASYKKIRSINVIIRDDSDSTFYALNGSNAISDAYPSYGNIGSISSTNVNLTRVTGGVFDNNSFDLTSFNRGWVTIGYVD